MRKLTTVTLTREELVEAATDYLRKKEEIPATAKQLGEVKLDSGGLTATWGDLASIPARGDLASIPARQTFVLKETTSW